MNFGDAIHWLVWWDPDGKIVSEDGVIVCISPTSRRLVALSKKTGEEKPFDLSLKQMRDEWSIQR